jgi:raffinose/stachyose/melibiose transport system permease protein
MIRKAAIRVLLYLFLIGFTFLTLYPLFWLFTSSFKTNQEILLNSLALPTAFHFENYSEAWSLARMGLFARNSVIYAASATVFTVLLSVSTGYGLGKFRYRVSGLIYSILLLGLVIPIHATLIPLFLLLKTIRILDTMTAVILPYIAFAMPLGTFLAATYIRDIPDEMEESAVMDGCGYLRIYWNIVLPIARPVMMTIMIITFLNNWNEFIFVFLFTSSLALRSLSVGLLMFAGPYTKNYAMQFAAMVIASLPMICMYFAFRKPMVRGMVAGAVKG